MRPANRTVLLSALAGALALGFVSVNVSPAAAQDGSAGSRETVVTATRLDVGLPGTSTTIIDQDEIRRSPAQSLPELLATQAGVQSRDFSGGTAGARGTVDIRGFGAAASSNTLILLNGRRISPIDLSDVNFANIPIYSIKRIEIIRGNAGAVLYGDGAVGGVVNIVTDTAPPAAPEAGLEVAAGSFRYRSGDGSVRQSIGPVALSAYGTFIDSDGFRENNKLLQRNLITEMRHGGEVGDLFANIQLDDQRLGLPGVRRVTLTTNQLRDDPEGADTPFDHAEQQGAALTLGGTRKFGRDVQLIVDGGVRRRESQGTFISAFGAAFDNFVDTDIATWSLTPRVKLSTPILGLPGNLVAGTDVYYSDYHSNRQNHSGDAPIHEYDAYQTTAALYGQQTVALGDSTDVTTGLRAERVHVKARDMFDPGAPGAFGAQLTPRNSWETDWAANLGVDHRITREVTVFGRVGRGIRVPNVDERIATLDNAFGLLTQTSREAELGTRFENGQAFLQVSVYEMLLRHEIMLDPNVNFGTNINLDPTRRSGVELQGSFGITSDIRVRAGFAVTDARFIDGPYEGNAVPLVAPYTANAGIEWDATREIRLTGTVTYGGEKRLDNDQANFQPKIPDYALVDLRADGRLLETWHWSAQVNNLFDKSYFNYGVASAAVFGTYNAYSLPGRSFLARLGKKF